MKTLTSVIFKNSRRRIVIANKKENILGITELLIDDLRKRIEQKQLKLTL